MHTYSVLLCFSDGSSLVGICEKVAFPPLPTLNGSVVVFAGQEFF
jgi:hypothetical protein